MKLLFNGYEITLTVEEFAALVEKGVFDPGNTGKPNDFTPGLISEDDLKKMADKYKDFPKIVPDRPRPYDVVAVYGCQVVPDWNLDLRPMYTVPVDMLNGMAGKSTEDISEPPSEFNSTPDTKKNCKKKIPGQQDQGKIAPFEDA